MPTQQIADLRRQVDGLEPGDRAFAMSIIGAFDRGRASTAQLKWVPVLLDRIASAASKAPPLVVYPIVEMFQTALQSLKQPRLLVAVGGRKLRLSIAGPASRAPGSISISSTEREFAARTFFGRIHPDGRFEPNLRLEPAERAATAKALGEMAQNPTLAATIFGRETGRCCFCNLELTDRPSLDVGYGPVCADKWGLPWGTRPARQRLISA